MSKKLERTRFRSYGAALLWLMQSLALSGAPRPGELDPSFDPGSGLGVRGSTFNALVLQADGKLIIGGTFTNYSGTPVTNIARINPDGSLDPSYLGAGEGIVAMHGLADGTVLVGGHFSQFGGAARDQIARLNADGSLDPTFVPQAGFSGFYPEIFTIAVQADGKIIAGGTFDLTNSTNKNLARLHPDGRLDTTFQGHDFGSVLAVALQPDGKILLGGTFGIRRANADGSPDPSFAPVAIPNPAFEYSAVNAIHLYADGKILVGGSFSRLNGELLNNIARLTTDGRLDESFDAGVGADGQIRTLLVQPDGKIVVGGSFSNFNAFPRRYLARLLPTGMLDLGFRCDLNNDGLTNINPYFVGTYAMALQPDDKIVLAGTSPTVNGVERRGIARIYAGDAPDEAPQILTSPIDLTVSEGTNVTLSVDFKGVPSPGVQWQLNGSAITSATGNTLRLRNVRTSNAGDYTISLSNTLGVATGLVARLAVQPAPATPGAADVAFDPGDALVNPGSVNSLPSRGPRSSIRRLAVQADGKMIAAGNFSSFAGALTRGLVRLNRDGSLDRAFLSNAIALAPDLPIVDDILVQPDGKMIVAGNYRLDDPGHYTIGGLSRLNPDGTIDPSFNASVEGDYGGAPPFRLALRPDGKILVSGGAFYFTVDEKFHFHLALLNADGSLDPNFKSDAGIMTGQIRALDLQRDGRVLVGGFFSTFNGVPRSGLVRLDATGELDPAFSVGAGPDGSVYALEVQPDGRILVGGTFSTFAGVPRKYLARLSAEGNLDTSFDPGTNVVWGAQAIRLQPDGKILVAGGLYLGAGRQTNSIVRLLPDGSLDPGFTTLSDDVVYDLMRLDDGKILIGGAFSRLDNVLRNGIALLHGDPLLTASARSGGVFATTVATTTGKTYTLEFRPTLNEGTWTRLHAISGNGGFMTLTDPDANSTQRFYRLRVE